MQPPRSRDTTEPPRRMPPVLTEALMEHSPRLIIAKPTLIRVTDSPTGWLVVIPGTDEQVAEQEERRLALTEERHRSGRPNGPVQGATR